MLKKSARQVLYFLKTLSMDHYYYTELVVALSVRRLFYINAQMTKQ